LKEEDMARLSVMSLAEWSKADVDEIRERWEKRRREIEEIEKKKTEKEKRIEEARKRKEEKRRKAIRERRCFVCNIFRHMARYCRNREEKKGPAQVPVVATTRHSRTNDLTTSKALQWAIK